MLKVLDICYYNVLLHSRSGHHLEIFFSCTDTKISLWIRFLVFMNSYSLGFDSFKILHTDKHLGMMEKIPKIVLPDTLYFTNIIFETFLTVSPSPYA